jgi:hypothetical protein
MLEDNFHKIDAPEFSKDLLVGAEDIATWLFGAPETRRLYHLVETSRGGFGTFRLGSRIAVQKSVVRAAFWAQQKRSFSRGDLEALVRLRLLLLKTLELMPTIEGESKPGNGFDHGQLCLATHEAARAIERFLDDC